MKRQQLVHRGATVLALEPLDERQPVVQRLERVRVGLDAGNRIGDRARKLLHAHGQAFNLVLPVGGSFMIAGHLGNARAGGDQGRGGGPFRIARERLGGGVGAFNDLGGMRGGGMAGRKLRLVLGRQLGRLKLVDGIAQAFRLLGEVARVAGQGGTLLAQGKKRLPGRRIRGAVDASVGVEDLALEPLVQKRLVVVGAMHVHEQTTEGAERLDGGRDVVHVHAAAAGGGNRAPHEENPVLAGRKARFVKKTSHLLQDDGLGRSRQVEFRLDARLLRAVADGGGVGARAKRQFERAHEDALARARLARNDRETIAESNFSLFDDGEIQH